MWVIAVLTLFTPKWPGRLRVWAFPLKRNVWSHQALCLGTSLGLCKALLTGVVIHCLCSSTARKFTGSSQLLRLSCSLKWPVWEGSEVILVLALARGMRLFWIRDNHAIFDSEQSLEDKPNLWKQRLPSRMQPEQASCCSPPSRRPYVSHSSLPTKVGIRVKFFGCPVEV